MKSQLQLFGCLILILTIVTSCSKNPEPDRPNPAVVLPPSPPDREYFWVQRWDSTSRGYEIHLNIARLTQTEINRGIDVGVAVYSDWDPFVKIPFDYYDYGQKDTIHLSYNAIPGQLQVIAKASFKIEYPSDVFIEYK
jgi:hypothetical protein